MLEGRGSRFEVQGSSDEVQATVPPPLIWGLEMRSWKLER